MAAAAVAPMFERVIILERDDIDIDAASLSRPQAELNDMALDAQKHKSVGQMMMVHTLTPGGLHAFESLLPGFTEDATNQGAEQLDKNAILDDKIAIYMGPKRCARWTSETYTVLPASRALVERSARLRLIKDFKNIVFRTKASVDCNLFSKDGKFVTGVQLKGGEEIQAALVIDTTGRKGLTAMSWLKERGYGSVRSINIDPKLSYIIQHFQLTDEAMAKENRRRGLFIFPTHPHSRGITLQAIEGNIYTAGLILMNKEKRVDTLDDFMDRVKSLPSQEPYEMLKDATPVGEIYAMHGAKGTTRRFFEEVTMPDGFIIMGDAICSLNPRFGQGMTVAAMQGQALRHELGLQINRKGADMSKAVPRSAMQGFTNPFQKTAASVLAWPYAVATGGDLEFPFTTGPRTKNPLRKLVRAYIGAARDLGYKDSKVAQSLGETTLLMQPPIILFAPSMVRRVIPHGMKMLWAQGGPAARMFMIILLTGLLAMAASVLKPMIPSFA